jgi:hypothetical protein
MLRTFSMAAYDPPAPNDTNKKNINASYKLQRH